MKGGFGGLSVGGAAGTGTRAAGIHGWDAGPAREFLFFLSVPGFLKMCQFSSYGHVSESMNGVSFIVLTSEAKTGRHFF